MQSCNFGVSAVGEIIKRDGTRIVVFSDDIPTDKSGISKELSILLCALSDIDIKSLYRLIEAKVNYELVFEKCFGLTHSRTGQRLSRQQGLF